VFLQTNLKIVTKGMNTPIKTVIASVGREIQLLNLTFTISLKFGINSHKMICDTINPRIRAGKE
jgi:hypothetical protein